MLAIEIRFEILFQAGAGVPDQVSDSLRVLGISLILGRKGSG
jgi:hypothetical protein